MLTKLRMFVGTTSLVAVLGLAGADVRAADKIPETAAEHKAAADEYGRKAKEHRAESEMHSRMAEMYGARVKGPHSNRPNPWLLNMVKHCKKAAQQAEALAKTEEAAAEVHAKQATAGDTAAKN